VICKEVPSREEVRHVVLYCVGTKEVIIGAAFVSSIFTVKFLVDVVVIDLGLAKIRKYDLSL